MSRTHRSSPKIGSLLPAFCLSWRNYLEYSLGLCMSSSNFSFLFPFFDLTRKYWHRSMVAFGRGWSRPLAATLCGQVFKGLGGFPKGRRHQIG
jgi:hypothetical protein